MICWLYSHAKKYQTLVTNNTFQQAFVAGVERLVFTFLTTEKNLLVAQQLLTVTPEPDRTVFHNFTTRELLKHSGMEGIMWVPVVPSGQIALFTQSMRNEVLPHFAAPPPRMVDDCRENLEFPMVPMQFVVTPQPLAENEGISIEKLCAIKALLAGEKNSSKVALFNYVNTQQESFMAVAVPVSKDAQLQGFIVGLIDINIILKTHFPEPTGHSRHHLTLTSESISNQDLYGSQPSPIILSKDINNDRFELTARDSITLFGAQVLIHYQMVVDPMLDRYQQFFLCFALLSWLVFGVYIYYRYHLRCTSPSPAPNNTGKTCSSRYDPLTGLLNKQALLEELSNIKHSTVTNFTPFTLLFIDLDRFKKVNDTAGHLAGDRLLKLTAERLVKLSTPDDVLYRFSGDEFIVILKNKVDSKEITQHAQLYIREMQQVFHFDSYQFTLSASIGICTLKSPLNESVKLIKNADIAMCHAKANGGAQLAYFKPEMLTNVITEHKLENDLKSAISSHNLEVYYQPIYDKCQNIRGFEALLRWQHPTLGILSPQRFIPLAEKNGLIHDIGQFVLKQVIKQLQKLKNRLPEQQCPYISVNVSALEINQNYVQQAALWLAEYRVQPEHLAIELTETALAKNSDEVETCLNQIHRAGIKLFIDDFGTGYSTLARLKSIPFEVLKIDRSFISSLKPHDKQSCDFVKALIDFSLALHLEVIAEGVECKYTEKWLIEQGCHLLQGYLYARPVPANKMWELLNIAAEKTTTHVPITTMDSKKHAI